MQYFTTQNMGEEELSQEAKSHIKKLPKNFADIVADAINQACEKKPKRLNILRSLRMTKNIRLQQIEYRDTFISSKDFEIPARFYIPQSVKNRTDLPLYLYIHGGGWTLGDIDSCDNYCQNVALKSNCIAVCIAYRLAPEFPHPTPLLDCINAFNYLAQNSENFNSNSDKIFVGGDSAGAQLALALTNAQIAAKKTSPRGLLLFYPVTTLEDFSDDESCKLYAKNYNLDASLMECFKDAYAPKKIRPFISPQNFSTLNKFPPTLLISSHFDILNCQSKKFANTLQSLRVPTRHIHLNDAPHGFLTAPNFECSLNFSVNESSQFLSHLCDGKKSHFNI